MSNPEGGRHTRGANFRIEPQDLTFINADPTIRVSFEKVECIRFCEKNQGYNVQLTKESAMNFNGLEVNIGELTFPFLDVSILYATKIPLQGGKWFNGMPLDISNYKDFLKLEYRDKGYGSIILKEYLIEHHK